MNSNHGARIYRLLALLLLVPICHGSTGRGLHYPGRSDLFELSVIHLNDFHARFEQTNPRSGTCQEGEETSCVGGIARISTAVNRLLKERPNAIFLNAGDHYQGTLWYTVYRWNVTATFMNMLPHDAMTLGNHEFDNDVEGVVPFLKMVKAPVVVTNIDATEEPTMQGLYKNSTIIERNGTKIGVIGVILSTTNKIATTGKLKFLDEVETVNEEAGRLKSQGVDIIIVLSHCGLDVDRIMAAKCPLIDLVVGGHSHTFLYTGPPPFIDKPADKYPVEVVQEGSNRTVLIVQAAAFTKYLGNLTVWFDGKGEVVDWDGNPILLDKSIEQDPEIVKALEPWKVVVDEQANVKIAKSRVYLDNECWKKECNFGNLITDAMVDSYVEKAENETVWTYAAVGVMNTGGIRIPIDSAGGYITYSDLLMAQPFENTWDILELNGSCILQILNMKEKLAWSGLKVIYTGSSKIVKEVKIRCRACEVPKFEDLKQDEWYRIVVPTFLVGAGDGFVLFKSCGRNHEVGHLDWEQLAKYMKKDTMMDCEGDAGGLDELVDLATDVADSSPTIRDAAERLLTLLGVDEEESEESPVSSSSSSEDEGVELDGELEDEEEERVDGRLLHQLAASLANELKQSRERAATTTAARPGDREPRRMEVIVAGTNRADHSCLQDRSFKGGAGDCRDVASKWGRRRDGECSFGKRRRRRPVSDEPRRRRPDGRSRLGQGGGEGLVRTGQVLASSWSAGWDACATEALRYLVEDEGLPPHHPTVLAMKDHLEVQRERAFLRYAA